MESQNPSLVMITRDLQRVSRELASLTESSKAMHDHVHNLTELCNLLRHNLHVACEKLIQLGYTDAEALDVSISVPSLDELGFQVTLFPNKKLSQASILDEDGRDIVALAKEVIDSVKKVKTDQFALGTVEKPSNSEGCDECILKPRSLFALDDASDLSIALVNKSQTENVDEIIRGLMDSISKQQQVVDIRGKRIERLESQIYQHFNMNLDDNTNELRIGYTPFSSTRSATQNSDASHNSYAPFSNVKAIARNNEISLGFGLFQPQNCDGLAFSREEVDDICSELDVFEVAIQVPEGLYSTGKIDTEQFSADINQLKRQIDVLWSALNISEDELEKAKLELSSYKSSSLQQPQSVIPLHETHSLVSAPIIATETAERQLMLQRIKTLEESFKKQAQLYTEEIDLLRNEIALQADKFVALKQLHSQQIDYQYNLIDNERRKHREQLKYYVEKCSEIQKTLVIERSRFENLLKFAEDRCGAVDIRFESRS